MLFIRPKLNQKINDDFKFNLYLWFKTESMKLKIALVCGGYSGEAEVSMRSAAFVESTLDRSKYEVYKIEVTQQYWRYQHLEESYLIDRNDFTLSIEDRKISFDLVFMMIHGSPGENGQLQGYFEMLDIPYTCCDSLTSALTMNKAYTKAVIDGIEDMYLARSIQLMEDNQESAEALIADKLRLPLFVKPNAGGSSIGMSKVTEAAGVRQAVDLAFETVNAGRQVLVEEFVTGREFSIGVYRFGKEVDVLPATEVITQRDFFDYEAKYTPGLTEEITPASLNEEQRLRAERIVKEIYKRLNCRGLVRIDFFLEEATDRFYFIEVNTIPGQTQTSFIPQQIRASGRTETDFYAAWIDSSYDYFRPNTEK